MTNDPTVQAISAAGHDYYAVVVDDIPITVAEVTHAAHDIDGDLVRPTTIQFIWTPPSHRRRGYGRLLVEYLRELYPDLSHDGHLSKDGQALVERHNLPMREGKLSKPYEAAAADELGRSTYDKVRAAWHSKDSGKD